MVAIEGAIAQPSQKTLRAREKLEEKLKKEQITEEALKKTVEGIHKWIADNAQNRVRVETEEMGLFNGNKDAAAVSKKVAALASSLLQNGEIR